MPHLLYSNKRGDISADRSLCATGAEAHNISKLDPRELIKLPEASRLFMLPARAAIGYDPVSGRYISNNSRLAVAAFLPPGYTAARTAAYYSIGRPSQLPLFAYTAVCEHKNALFAAAIRVDKDKRHDCRYIDIEKVRKNTLLLSKLFSGNRLIGHLTECALIHGCPNAQNFFLGRYEAPLPTSPSCNSSCLGCISLQTGGRCPATQPRIKFVPTKEEISEIALFHINNTASPIVSFGQGCEGEPLLQYKLIGSAIRAIRKATAKGTIHINTNGSSPKAIKELISYGLNSVRISLNSARNKYYTAYYRPKGYRFNDVIDSIKTAKACGAFVSLNYLTMPGFTDIRDEFSKLEEMIHKHKVDMIQWRNLNYDPERYFKQLKVFPKANDLLGIKNVISSLEEEFPDIRMGYFNPVIH